MSAYSSRASLRETVLKQRMFSIPHYWRELKDIRGLRDLYQWIYYKHPHIFPLAALPPYVTIEVTNACNLACSHCWRSLMTRPIGYIDPAWLKEVIRSVDRIQPAILKIGGTGELSLHPALRDVMNCLSEYHGNRVFVYSNGMLLAHYSAEVLNWNIHTLVISIDGTDAESYARLRVGGDYQSLRVGVEEFFQRRKHAGKKSPIIEIRHTVMPNETAADLSRFRNHWLGIADTVKFNRLVPLTLTGAGTRKSPCAHIRREFCIEWDGGVRLCSFFDHCVGNLHSSTIEELWHGKGFRFVRECHDRLDYASLPTCKNCV